MICLLLNSLCHEWFDCWRQDFDWQGQSRGSSEDSFALFSFSVRLRWFNSNVTLSLESLVHIRREDVYRVSNSSRLKSCFGLQWPRRRRLCHGMNLVLASSFIELKLKPIPPNQQSRPFGVALLFAGVDESGPHLSVQISLKQISDIVTDYSLTIFLWF